MSVIAAVYARKSTDQLGLTDEQKSVTRQVEHARAYAVRKGWTVLDECVFVDDAVSGAEFATRPGFVRLMRALKPYPPFQILVMAEESQLGREQIEVAYALKQLTQAGVRVWLYLEDRERTLDSPTDKLLMSVTAFADELEREKARQRTYDALARKARAGQVTGGVVSGYRNREVVGGGGRHQYVEREIAPEARPRGRDRGTESRGHSTAPMSATVRSAGVWVRERPRRSTRSRCGERRRRRHSVRRSCAPRRLPRARSRARRTGAARHCQRSRDSGNRTRRRR